MLGKLDRMAEKMGWTATSDEYEYEEDYQYNDEGEGKYEENNFVPTLHRAVKAEKNMDFSRIVTVRPNSYADARLIGESFREGIPVIVNLSDTADDRRIIDFCAGLIFGLHGSIEEITTNVILLSPESVKVQGKTTSAVKRGEFF